MRELPSIELSIGALRTGFMSNLITRTTELAMSVTLSYIDNGDTVIDATCGAGQDTVTLANAAGEDGCVYPQINTGRTYEDYLRILLYAKDDTIKTARILDLIQINMRKNHDEAFLIQECATGVSVSADVNGKTLSRDRIY